MDPRSLLALIVTLVLWGSAFPALRATLPYFEPGPLALLRFLIASATLALFSLLSRASGRVEKPLGSGRDRLRTAFAGVVGIAGYALALNTGQQTVPAGPASLLVNTAPLWTALAATLFLQERPGRLGWMGLTVGFSGAGLIALRKGVFGGWDPGAAWVLAAAGAHSAYIVLQKPLMDRYGALAATRRAMYFGTLALLPFSASLYRAWPALPRGAIAGVAYLGVFPAALAYATWGVVLKRMPASRAVGFLYMVPLAAYMLAWLWLGEAPTWPALAGGALVAVGVGLINAGHRRAAAKIPAV